MYPIVLEVLCFFFNIYLATPGLSCEVVSEHRLKSHKASYANSGIKFQAKRKQSIKDFVFTLKKEDNLCLWLFGHITKKIGHTQDQGRGLDRGSRIR